MKYWAVFIISLMIVACQDVQRPEKPKNLIDKDVMAEVLTEAYLANAGRSVDNKTVEIKGVKLDSFIYTKFGIDSLQFVRSNDYYAADINTYVDIFQKVEENLKAIENRLDSIRDLDPTKNNATPKAPIQKGGNSMSGNNSR
ncbi:MAG TPA: DUF4296 domain-containing protein [Aequorivita sp.]|nr:DUF4296 domain-containing protein [Aequorivita sp.]